MAEPASKLTDRLYNEAGWLESFGVARTASGLAVLLNEAASALEQAETSLCETARKFTLEQERARIAEKALAHYARLDHVTEPDEGFVARDALAVLEPDG